MDICIDKDATLEKFTDAEITVLGWCTARGFKRDRFYHVINNTTLKRRDCIKAKKILKALKKEGLLVLQKTKVKVDSHDNQDISSPLMK